MLLIFFAVLQCMRIWAKAAITLNEFHREVARKEKPTRAVLDRLNQPPNNDSEDRGLGFGTRSFRSD